MFLATAHGIVSSGSSLVSGFAVLATGASVLGAHIKTMGPAVVEVQEELLGGVGRPEGIAFHVAGFAVGCVLAGSGRFGWGSAVVGSIGLLVGEILELLAEEL